MIALPPVEDMETTRPVRARTIGLHGRTALVLGAVGEEGRAAADTLAALGARVVVADDDRTALEHQYGDDERFDLPAAASSSSEGLEALAAALPEIDVLIHRSPNSAPGSRQGPIDSGLDALRHFIPGMAQRRRGSIIALARSSSHFARARGHSGGVGQEFHQAVRGLASELRPFGVRVNAVAPDGVEPTMAVRFLSSDSSAHVTGAVLAMERGWSTLESLDTTPATMASLRPLGAVLGAVPRGRASADHPGLTALPPRPQPIGSKMSEEAYERRRA